MSRDDLLNVLKDLVHLHRIGALTQEEFQETKRLLLAQLQAAAEVPSSRPVSAPRHSTELSPPSQQPPVSSIRVGQVLLGRYRLEGILGQGGMGQVFLCYDQTRERQYALKLIHPHLAQYPELRTRFLQELEANERLTHPGIVRTYALEQDPEQQLFFFTMEYIEGITLGALFKHAETQKRVPLLPLSVMLPLFSELISILEFAHSKGVIHRDIKPSNVMLTQEGSLKLMDFGIAKVLEGTSGGMHTGFGGFVYYMAPEQLKGDGKVSFAADVFSLGAIIYQLLTGEIPMGALIPPSHLWSALGTEIDAVLLRAMDPRLSNRYAHPREFWSELEPLLQSLLAKRMEPQPWDQGIVDWFQTSQSELRAVQEAAMLNGRNHRAQQGLQPFSSSFGPSSPSSEQASPYQKRDASPSMRLIKQISPSSPLSKTSPAKRSAELTGFRTVRAQTRTPSSFSRTHFPGRSLNRSPKDSVLPEYAYRPELDRFENNEMISLELPSQPLQPPPESSQESATTLLALLEDSVDESEDTQNLGDDLELQLEEESQDVWEMAIPSVEGGVHELPPVEAALQERILFAKDGTPLLKLVEIPAGSFLMGSRESGSLSYQNEIPQRTVEMSTYWFARTPLTNRIWLKFVEESSYHCEDPDYLLHWRGGRPGLLELEHPVIYISYEDAQAFCDFYGLAIPTEAQWEKAARGTEGQIWPWGNQKPHARLCNFLGLQSSHHYTRPRLFGRG